MEKSKAAPMRSLLVPETFACAALLQDSDDGLDKKMSAILDKKMSEIVENKISNTCTAKGASPPSITNQSKNTELSPSDLWCDKRKSENAGNVIADQ